MAVGSLCAFLRSQDWYKDVVVGVSPDNIAAYLQQRGVGFFVLDLATLVYCRSLRGMDNFDVLKGLAGYINLILSKLPPGLEGVVRGCGQP